MLSGWKRHGVLVRVVLLWVIPLLAGCGGPREAPASLAPKPLPPSAAPPLVDSRGRPIPSSPGSDSPAPGAELAWTTPEGWRSEAPSSSMRRAQYSLPRAPGDPADGECAVFYFGPGQGGDVRANVDRWASQFTADAGGAPTPKMTETSVAGLKVLRVVLEGTYAPSPMMGGDTTPKPGTRLLGAIVQGPDANWFFKCTGPKKTMEARRGEFDAMIDSIHTH